MVISWVESADVRRLGLTESKLKEFLWRHLRDFGTDEEASLYADSLSVDKYSRALVVEWSDRWSVYGSVYVD